MKLRLGVLVSLVLAGLIVPVATADGATTGSISGIIRADGQPRADGWVTVIGIVDNGFYGKGPAPIAGGPTDANGKYTISDLPPSGFPGYWICFEDSTGIFGNYEGQCWDQVDGYLPFPSGAGFLDPAPGSKRLVVAAGQQRTGIDADLHRYMGSGGGISGAVTQFGVIPLHTALVTARQNGVTIGATYTAGNGRYKITGLPVGSYQVCFDGSHAAGGTFRTYSTTCRTALVKVTGGKVTTGISAALTAGH